MRFVQLLERGVQVVYPLGLRHRFSGVVTCPPPVRRGAVADARLGLA